MTRNDKDAWTGHGPFNAAFQAAAELVGKRWVGAVIWAVVYGEHRFGEIRNAIPGISDRLLTERLKELVEAGILERREDEAGGPGYYLTPRGLDLRRVLMALHDWALAGSGRG
ncbi:MAG TPA: helix-turn-helix domain-containing protein [Tabrizicola sp.]|nr:helix-turn-helix domain-containing protein [Tabrizicola sp.]